MDFTTTAMNRPEIVDLTYASFSEYLTGLNMKQCRLFINIDPLPEGDRGDVIKVCKKYFGEVIANCPDTPNYTAAYNWLWSNATTKFIFNLEDDWGLYEKISINTLLNFFDDKKRPDLLEVALRAYTYEYQACPTSPSVMHQRFYKAVGGKLNPKINPEIQLRGKKFGIFMPAAAIGGYKGRIIAYPDKVVLTDLGREWIDNSDYIKPKVRKDKFTKWVKKKK